MSKLYDYTALSSLLECEQEWDYRYRQHLARPTADVSPHFGTAVHAGVRALFDGAPKEVVADAVSVAWGDFVAPEKKAHLNLAYAQQVVEMYGEVYGLVGQSGLSGADPQFPSAGTGSPRPTSSFELSGIGARLKGNCSDSNEVVAAHPTDHRVPRLIGSSPFDLVLNERYLEWPERLLCGIVDRVVRAKSDGQLYVMDLKTSGLYLGAAFFEQYRHSLQAAIYLDLVENELELRRIDYMSEIDPNKLKVVGFWVDAIHLDRRGYPKREDFSRVGPFAYSQELRAELRALVNRLVDRATALEEKPDLAYKNPRSCFRFGSLCSYFRFCTLDPSDRKDAVQMALAAGDFVEEKWEPASRK